MDLELMKAKIEANSPYNDGWTRQFYQEIVDKIAGKLPVISEKVKARIQKVKQTKKNKKN